MKKLLVVLVCGLILLGARYSQRAAIAERLMTVALPQQMDSNQAEVLEDSLPANSAEIIQNREGTQG